MSSLGIQFLAKEPAFQPATYLVRKKEDQSALKGYLWLTGGSVLAVVPPSLIALTIVFGGATLASSPVPPVALCMAGGFVVSGLATCAVLEGVKTCYQNAMYHYGPQLEIIG